jgi:hypothetical protein
LIGLNDEKGIVYRGSKLIVVECLGANLSLTEALKSERNQKKDTHKQTMFLQIARLADTLQLSKLNYRQEGCLPVPDNNKHFYAFKKIPLRGYCWYSRKHQHTLFISHYIMKRTDKLSPKDTRLVHYNWDRIEAGTDER